MERLDNRADAAFDAPCTTNPSLNGFFLRDDVPADFHTQFPGISVIESDFIDPTVTNKEESQDQVYHVQHGLALVVALVPDSVVVQGQALRPWAIEQARRITQHFAHDDWIIRNPACGNRAVNRGENTIAYSYGETLAATYVTAGTFNPTTDPFWAGIWDTLRSPTNPAYDDENNLHMALAIMAVGDGYGADTPQVMATLADTQDWPVYPLMHRGAAPREPGLLYDGAHGQRARAADARRAARLRRPRLPGPERPGVARVHHAQSVHPRQEPGVRRTRWLRGHPLPRPRLHAAPQPLRDRDAGHVARRSERGPVRDPA